MRLQHRLRKLEASLPSCGPAVQRLVDEEYVLTEADRCPRCGGCHVLVIKTVIVEARSDVATQPQGSPC